MNTYPHEFLAHHALLMFIAGLGTSSSSNNTSNPAITHGQRNSLSLPPTSAPQSQPPSQSQSRRTSGSISAAVTPGSSNTVSISTTPEPEEVLRSQNGGGGSRRGSGAVEGEGEGNVIGYNVNPTSNATQFLTQDRPRADSIISRSGVATSFGVEPKQGRTRGDSIFSNPGRTSFSGPASSASASARGEIPAQTSAGENDKAATSTIASRPRADTLSLNTHLSPSAQSNNSVQPSPAAPTDPTPPNADEFDQLKSSLRELFTQGVNGDGENGRAGYWPRGLVPAVGGGYWAEQAGGGGAGGEGKTGTGGRGRFSTTPHSPLSPLHPASPVYPDGLINPLWVRRRAEGAPAVWVVFLRLFEWEGSAGAGEAGLQDNGEKGRSRANSVIDPLRTPTTASSVTSPKSSSSGSTAALSKEEEKRKKEAERRADEELVREIAERRKKWQERVVGVKVTVVLMASREALDDTTLDARLSFIRRQSGLDSRASLFVLTPVGLDELQEFVMSLKDALYEPSQEFYASLFKRNRKKRSRLPSNPNQPPYPVSLPAGGKALTAAGWAVRYDWKGGWFAEVRGDFEIARRSYEDAWYGLAQLLATPNAMSPRTKRWAEAKVLADCIAVKIVKLHFFNHDAPSAVGFFQQHLSRYGEMSRQWGIGEETFEFWSWVARQYRMFAELLELALSAGLKIEEQLPAYLPASPPINAPNAGPLQEDELVTTNLPLTTLQHPGYYYYAAASCTSERKKRFDEAIEAEANGVTNKAATSPSFANEKNVDHTSLVIELFTKAYSHFKHSESGQARMSLYIAFRIAEAYKDSGQNEMTIKFCQRIAKTYKKENWNPVLRAIRDIWYEAARLTGSVESAATLLLDMMSPGASPKLEDPTQYQEDLNILLSTTTPGSDRGCDYDLNSNSPLFRVSASFLSDKCDIGDEVGLAVQIDAASGAQFEQLEFSTINVVLPEGLQSLQLEHAQNSGAGVGKQVAHVEPNGSPATADLCFKPGSTLVFAGKVSVDREMTLEVLDVTMSIIRGGWTLTLHSGTGLPPMHSLGPAACHTSVICAPIPLRITTSFKGPDTGYVHDPVTVRCIVSNKDRKPASLRLSADVRDIGGDPESAAAAGTAIIKIGDEERPKAFLHHPLPEIASGASHEISITVTSDLALTRILAVGIQPADGSSEAEYLSIASTNIAFIEPFVIKESISHGFHAQGETIQAEVTVGLDISMIGDAEVLVKKLAVESGQATALSNTLDSLAVSNEQYPMTWPNRTRYSVFEVYTAAPSELQLPTPPTVEVVIDWTSTDSPEETRQYRRPISLQYRPASHLVATVDAPSRCRFGDAFEAKLRVFNIHDSLPAANVALSIEFNDAFVWTGLRQSHIASIPAGGVWEDTFSITPVGNPGGQHLPRFRVGIPEGEAFKEIAITNAANQDQAQPERTGFPIFIKP